MEPSASAPPLIQMAPTFPGGFVVPHIADRRTSPEVLNVPSLPSPAPVLDNMLPTGPQASLDPPVTGSDRASSPEAHQSLLASASPGPSHPRPSSAPVPGAATEGEGSTKVALHNERDLPAILENVTTTTDLPQLPSPDATTAIETRMDAIERIAMMLGGESNWTCSARPRSRLRTTYKPTGDFKLSRDRISLWFFFARISFVAAGSRSPGQFHPCPSSVPDPGAVIEGEGSMKAALHKERDALDPPLAIWENIMASLDLPLPSPSLSLATDVAIAEDTGNHPPHPSHDRGSICVTSPNPPDPRQADRRTRK
ncbi:hypothetical protein H4582DRAFT_2060222 [Lactarius indigo]|nr:hypothetical protein H4582DRAFT_2060222 [Lactarius indigo]